MTYKIAYVKFRQSANRDCMSLSVLSRPTYMKRRSIKAYSGTEFYSESIPVARKEIIIFVQYKLCNSF